LPSFSLGTIEVLAPAAAVPPRPPAPVAGCTVDWPGWLAPDPFLGLVIISAPKVSRSALLFYASCGKWSSVADGIMIAWTGSPPFALYYTSSYAKCSNSSLRVSTVDCVSCLNDSDFSN
jgi:hypothetical protein